MNETKSTWNKKMCVEWLHERHARIRKTVAVTFLISPAFSYFFRFTWSGNQGGQHMCPSYGNADRMAGTYEYYDKFGHHRTRSYTKSTTNGEEEEQYIFRKKNYFRAIARNGSSRSILGQKRVDRSMKAANTQFGLT